MSAPVDTVLPQQLVAFKWRDLTYGGALCVVGFLVMVGRLWWQKRSS
jgi:hypothetical protein